MKAIFRKTGLIIIAAALVLPVMAQTFSTAQTGDATMQSQQILTGGVYTGTVYEPFSNTLPSEQTYAPAKAPGHSSGPRKAFDTGAETGQSEEFPIGDAVLPMLLMALVFSGVIMLRRKRSATKAPR